MLATTKTKGGAKGAKKTGKAAPKEPTAVPMVGYVDRFPFLREEHARLEARHRMQTEDEEEGLFEKLAVNMDDVKGDTSHMPWATGSTTNMFTHLVWRMLDACETGSTGGDACREGGVLGAAVTEVVNSRGAVKEQFELALGMSLAWYNHETFAFMHRGDPEQGHAIITHLGTVWKKLLKFDEATLEAKGVKKEARDIAIKVNTALKNYFASKDHYNTFTFNFMVKPTAPKKAAAAAKPKAAPKPKPKPKPKAKAKAKTKTKAKVVTSKAAASAKSNKRAGSASAGSASKRSK